MAEVTLIIASPDGTKQLPLDAAALTIGRTAASAVALPGDTGLSRRHATLHRDGEHVWVVDENSTNGTFLNGEPVSPDGATLADGDELRIGNGTSITVNIRSAAGATNGTPPPATAAVPAATPAASDSMLKFLLPAVALVVVLLGGIGFGLYKLTSGSESARGSDSEILIPTNAPAADTASGSASSGSVNASAAPQASSASPAASPGAAPEVSILSTDYNTEPIAAFAEPPASARKLYRAMSEEEQKEFIKQRAQHIAIMMGKRPYAFTPDALVHIKFWLDAFARRVGNGRKGLWGGDTIAILERGKTHAPAINRAFKEHRVPPVIGLYIPFIETEYTNISSDNFAGAAGLFQFLGPTAEHYGVPRAERTNVAKMAPAAARYFRDNIMSFGDDSMSVALSIAGYNRAPESVKRDLRNVINAQNNEDKERSFWTLIANQGKLDEYFQRENINYVPRFFAAAILGETPWAFGVEARPLTTYTQGATPDTEATASAAP